MVKTIERLFPDVADPEAVRKAYVLGYRAGYRDGQQKQVDATRPNYDDENIQYLPLEAMQLSVRVCNCLRLYGCRYVVDVAKVPADEILRMKGIGKVSADEIAQALTRLGIQDTGWEYAWMLRL